MAKCQRLVTFDCKKLLISNSYVLGSEKSLLSVTVNDFSKAFSNTCQSINVVLFVFSPEYMYIHDVSPLQARISLEKLANQNQIRSRPLRSTRSFHDSPNLTSLQGSSVVFVF